MDRGIQADVFPTVASVNRSSSPHLSTRKKILGLIKPQFGLRKRREGAKKVVKNEVGAKYFEENVSLANRTL
jgi:predicted rRNA methylase YqxC with S4 and FtsJ domains